MKPQYQPRVRIFAGPNGSGKSSLKSSIAEALGTDLLGIFINADEIEKLIKEKGFLDLQKFKIEATQAELSKHFANSELLKNQEIKIILDGSNLKFLNVNFNSYHASVIAEFIREKLLQKSESFSFETVMSSADKIEFLKKANQLGYKTYLYFIATESPLINISRVQYRVSCGGHNVPEDKITSRYYRSLDLLIDAIKNSWRSYIFDNSENNNSPNKESWIAEIENGKILEIKSETIPAWFNEYVIKKINSKLNA